MLPRPEQFSLRDQRRRMNDDTGARERAFADAWDRWIKHNPTFIDRLIPRGDTPLGFVQVPTKAEIKICREIISWLGTNCGMDLLSDALKSTGYQIHHTSNADSTALPPPITVPLNVLTLIRQWPGSSWLYTDTELRTTLPLNYADLLSPYLLCEQNTTDTLYGLNPLGCSIWRNSSHYVFLATEQNLASTEPIPSNLNF